MLSESSAPILSIQGPGEHLKFFGNSLSCLSSHTDKVNLFSPMAGPGHPSHPLVQIMSDGCRGGSPPSPRAVHGCLMEQ